MIFYVLLCCTKAQMDALVQRGAHWQSAVQIFDRLGLGPELGTWFMLIQDVGR